MHPTLFSIGDHLHFHSYAVTMAVAFLVAVLLSVRENYKLEHPYPITPIGGLWVFLGGLFGAKVYWILQYSEPQYLYQAFYLWSGGLVFYGGLIGGVLGGIGYIMFCRAPVLPLADIALPFVPLAHSIARVGCFLNGCCWGGTTDLPWGVHFPSNTLVYRQHLEENLIEPGAAMAAAVHPVQLYATGSLFMLFLVLRYAYKRKQHTGSIALLYVGLYGIHRFVMEFFRGDYGSPVFGMTVSQVVALGFVVLAALLYGGLRLTLWRRPSAARSAAA